MGRKWYQASLTSSRRNLEIGSSDRASQLPDIASAPLTTCILAQTLVDGVAVALMPR